MTFAVFDFDAIAKEARLKRLEGNPQNVVKEPEPEAEYPVVFDGYGMYAGFDAGIAGADPAPTSHVYWMDATGSLIDLSTAGYDTAPFDYGC